MRTHRGKWIFSEEEKTPFLSAFDVNKCLKQIRQPRSLQTCAPISEWPFHISTMGKVVYAFMNGVCRQASLLEHMRCNCKFNAYSHNRNFTPRTLWLTFFLAPNRQFLKYVSEWMWTANLMPFFMYQTFVNVPTTFRVFSLSVFYLFKLLRARCNLRVLFDNFLGAIYEPGCNNGVRGLYFVAPFLFRKYIY